MASQQTPKMVKGCRNVTHIVAESVTKQAKRQASKLGFCEWNMTAKHMSARTAHFVCTYVFYFQPPTQILYWKCQWLVTFNNEVYGGWPLSLYVYIDIYIIYMWYIYIYICFPPSFSLLPFSLCPHVYIYLCIIQIYTDIHALGCFLEYSMG